MVDILSKEERSKRMSLIKGKWTKPEKRMHNLLKGRKIRHEMHPKILGSPDIILKDKKIAIFIHGCFWHGCKKCYVAPSSNKEFWVNKLEKNVVRDKKNINVLRKHGWVVIIIWEHEIDSDSTKCVSSVIRKAKMTQCLAGEQK